MAPEVSKAMLFLKNTPIDQILSMGEMIDVIEDTLKEIASGRGFEPPRRRMHHPNRLIFGILAGSVTAPWALILKRIETVRFTRKMS